MAAKKKSASNKTGVMSVSSKIISEFADTLSADPETPGVGERLRKVLVEDRDFSDTAIRQALFGDATL